MMMSSLARALKLSILNIPAWAGGTLSVHIQGSHVLSFRIP